MSKIKIKDTDKGMKALIKLLDRRLPSVAIGILGDSGTYDDGPTTLQVATWHEFGTGRIPKRSFIRDTFDINRQSFQTKLKLIAVQVLHGQATYDQKIALFGVYVEGVIKKRIAAGILPKLADSTLAYKKGKTTPLIFTGQLRNSITSEVRRGS